MPGCENIARTVVGTSRMVVPVTSSSAEQHADEQQRRRDPRGQSVRKRTTDRKPDEARGVLPSGGLLRRPGPQMPQPERGQRDHRRTEHQPGPGLGVGLGAHQHHRDRGQRDRQQDAPPNRRASAGRCRSTVRRAGPHRTRSSRAITTAMPSRARAMPSRRWPGSRSRALPTERAVDPAPLGQHQPACPGTPADGLARRRDRATGCGAAAGFRRGAATGPVRELAFDLLERVPERRRSYLACGSSLVACAPYSPSATRVTDVSQSIPLAQSHWRHNVPK